MGHGCSDAGSAGRTRPDLVGDDAGSSSRDVGPLSPDAIGEPDAGAGPDAAPERDAEADSDVVPERVRCPDLQCEELGRVCIEADDGSDAECGACRQGLVEGESGCVEPVAGTLGGSCVSDADCSDDEWCSTVPGLERCSPRVLATTPHPMDFVYIPAGTFRQGTTGATDDERPYTATLTRSYFVSRTEVTQGQWREATDGINPSCYQQLPPTGFNTCTTDNANDLGPVEQVDFYAALAYSNWLSRQQGLEPCYGLAGCDEDGTDWHDGTFDACKDVTFVGLDCNGYRLLTESEWERAARAGSTSTYSWGDSIDIAALVPYAWFNMTCARPGLAGQTVMNGFGLYDTAGNVHEWAWDWAFSEDGGMLPYPRGSATDYLGAPTGAGRAVRGGAYRSADFDVRPAARAAMYPSASGSVNGVRLARTAP
jgi:formylglycine-generating enzyme required for sulfatase activity